MHLVRPTRVEYSLEEMIENLQRESDAAVLTARAALGAAEGGRRLDIPRRFPDVLPKASLDVEERRAVAPERRPARPV